MNIVWIVGAGTSCTAGYPLVGDFFKRVYLERLNAMNALVGRPDFIKANFFEAAAQLTAHTSDLNVLLTSAMQARRHKDVQNLNDYVIGILDAVSRCHFNWWAQPELNAFADYLGASHSTVISFNYDMLIEEQLGLLQFRAMMRHPGAKRPQYTPPYRLGLAPGAFSNSLKRTRSSSMVPDTSHRVRVRKERSLC